MKRLTLLITAFAVALSLGLGAGNMALAADTPTSSDPGQEALNLLGKTGIGGKTPTEAGAQLPIIVGNIIRSALGLLGIVLVVLMLYAGFLWMTARGDATQVDKAKSTLTRAVIGAIIIFSAYAITGFVVTAVINAGK